jgi:hypothetical protein
MRARPLPSPRAPWRIVPDAAPDETIGERRATSLRGVERATVQQLAMQPHLTRV